MPRAGKQDQSGVDLDEKNRRERFGPILRNGIAAYLQSNPGTEHPSLELTGHFIDIPCGHMVVFLRRKENSCLLFHYPYNDLAK